jgi:hypothetical protein
MRKMLLTVALIGVFANTAQAHQAYNANGLDLIRMDNNEVLNIALAPTPGDPQVYTIIVDGHIFAVFGLHGQPEAGPIYAVLIS